MDKPLTPALLVNRQFKDECEQQILTVLPTLYLKDRRNNLVWIDSLKLPGIEMVKRAEVSLPGYCNAVYDGFHYSAPCSAAVDIGCQWKWKEQHPEPRKEDWTSLWPYFDGASVES